MFKGIFPDFIQGSCTKRKCAVSHITLQIGDFKADFAMIKNNETIYSFELVT
jgi:hypothetical protein